MGDYGSEKEFDDWFAEKCALRNRLGGYEDLGYTPEELKELLNRTMEKPMKNVITRKRYIIVRDGTDIMCGLAREYHFKPMSDIGDTQIKTYSREKKAIAGFERSWNLKNGGRYEVVEVEEVIKVNKDLPSGETETNEKWVQLSLDDYLN